MASSSSSSVQTDHEKYDVFISLRGSDTGNNFASHLSAALCLTKMKVACTEFEDGVERSVEEVSSASLKAIWESKVSVIIFSENYASSPRCLEELNHILQCKGKNGQIVLPVFYNVNPSHIRKQQGSYKAAIVAHEERFKDSLDKVRQWRYALTKATNLSAWDSSVARSESKLVEEIVQHILQKLYTTSPSDDLKGLVGVNKRIDKIESLLQMGSLDHATRIVGIGGVSGIGKTTLARGIFNKFASRFEGSHFLENVKIEAERCGLTHLQNKLFSALLKEKNMNSINWFAEDRLKCIKVLIVLDNVDDFDQLEYLAGGRDWFGHGSKIIITTRDVQVLEAIEVDGTYMVEELDTNEALELFCSKAFHGNLATSDYTELSSRVINHAKGIPSALKDLGCRLFSRGMEEWESEMSKLEKSSQLESTENVSRTSYNRFNNEYDRGY